MAADLIAGIAGSAHRRYVDVGGEHVRAGADAPGEPELYTAAAGTDLPTPPASCDVERVDVPNVEGLNSVARASSECRLAMFSQAPGRWPSEQRAQLPRILRV
jgi:hypothetical protein